MTFLNFSHSCRSLIPLKLKKIHNSWNSNRVFHKYIVLLSNYYYYYCKMLSSSRKLDCGISIDICKYALKILVQRVDSLQDQVNQMTHMKSTELFNQSQHFYFDFQETYDLYFFIYLGHFLRHSHHATQPFKRIKSMVKYYVLKPKSSQPVQHDYFWSHCVSSLLEM